MHFKASNVSFREKGLHEALSRGKAGKEGKKVDLSYHSARQQSPSRKVGEPGTVPPEKAQGKLLSCEAAIWKWSPELQHGESCSHRVAEKGVGCVGSWSPQRNQDKQQAPLKTELQIPKGECKPAGKACSSSQGEGQGHT